MKEEWDLKITENLNQMLRVRKEIELQSELPQLVVVKHSYHASDDMMFPDPSCLAFFVAFEENHLLSLEKSEALKLVAIDIFEGSMKFYIYCEDAQKTVYNCISYLKSNPNYNAEFEVHNDPSWQIFKNL